MSIKKHIFVCRAEDLHDGEYICLDLIYNRVPSSILVFRYHQGCYAYLNRCEHMPKRLDCENDMIFDDTGQQLRCTMHGITYDPKTGESLSDICQGKKLTPVKLLENHQGIWIVDKRAKALTHDLL